MSKPGPYVNADHAYTVLITKKLQSSGLSDMQGQRLGIIRLTPQFATQHDIPYFKGMVIPYFDLTGNPTEFWRVRYLEPTQKGFSAATAKKDLRYIQAKGSVNELYLPPLIDWSQHAKDISEPLIITEGELKAACAAALGFPVLGLGGVDCFRASRLGIDLLPQFEHLGLKGRAVYIVYDSDALQNPAVVRAENALAKKLIDRGAHVSIVRLPDVLPEGKTGLDDFLVHHGDNAPDVFSSLLAATPEYASSHELHRLNEEVMYVRDPGLIYHHESFLRLGVHQFKEHAYVNRIYTATELKADGGVKQVKKYAAKEWLEWQQRAEVQKLVYAPGKPDVINNCQYKYLNTWKGWGCEPAQGDTGPWQKLLDYIFADETSSRRWFEQWCACPLQNPGVKLFTAAVVWGRTQGTGKTLLGYTLMKIYGENAIEISDDDLSRGDNDFAEGKQFAVGEEITGGDKRGVADKLKSLISRSTMRINIKYVPRYEAKDCMNYYFTSNHPDAFFLEDDDRRYFIHEVGSRAPLARDFYQAYDSWYGGHGGPASAGVQALFHYLLGLDLKGFDPQGPAPLTASKLEMIDLGRSDLDGWVHKLRSVPDAVTRVHGKLLPSPLFTTLQLLRMYDPEDKRRVTENGMSRALKRAGIVKAARGLPCRLEDGSQARLWAVREPERFAHASHKLVVEEYARASQGTEKRNKFT